MEHEPEVEEHATTEGDPESARAQVIYQRLELVAQLLRDAPPGAGPRVLWRDGGGLVQAVALGSGLLIGRERGCNVILDDPSVSRRHCRISRDTSGVVLEDLKSMHGTQINGRQSAHSRVIDGGLIQVGGACLAYVE